MSVIEKPIQSISHSNLFLVTGEVVNVRVCTVNEDIMADSSPSPRAQPEEEYYYQP